MQASEQAQKIGETKIHEHRNEKCQIDQPGAHKNKYIFILGLLLSIWRLQSFTNRRTPVLSGTFVGVKKIS